MGKKVKRVLMLLFSILIAGPFPLLSGSQPVYAESVWNEENNARLEEAIIDAVNWVQKDEGTLFSDEILESAGSSYSDWLAFDFARLGVEQDQYDRYLKALEKYVTNAYQSDGLLDANKATEWHRISITIAALGGDPQAFGKDKEGNPINLIADGTYNRGKVRDLDAQGNNALIWALLTLDSGHYEVPSDACDTRESIIEAILQSQMESGAFTLMEDSPDIDITGMAIQALAPYYESEDVYTVNSSSTSDSGSSSMSDPDLSSTSDSDSDSTLDPDADTQENLQSGERSVTVGECVDAALSWLSGQQLENGGFTSWGVESSESTSQMIVALCCLGINPVEDGRFVKDGQNLFEGLLSFQQEDGGFLHSPDQNESDLMATEQALYALTAIYRLVNGYNGLYQLVPESDGNVITEMPFLQQTGNGGIGGKLIIVLIVIVLLIVFAAAVMLCVSKKKRKKSAASSKDVNW